MKKLFLCIILFISCDDIEDKRTIQKNLGESFYRKFGSIGYDYGNGIDFSPFDNGIIIVGAEQSKINGDKQLWAIKTDSRGFTLWEKKFGGLNDDEGYDVISTSDGGYLFVGYSWSYGNSQQIYAIKTDFHGNLEWEKTYGGSMWEVGNSVIEINGGGFAICGYSNSPGISSGNTDIFIIKIDKSGNVIWKKNYGNKVFPNHEWGYDIIQLYDQSFFVVGARDRYDKGSNNSYFIRLDKDGNLIWDKEIFSENQTNEIAYSISKSVDNNFYICIAENTISDKDIFNPKIIKIDSMGNIDWLKTYPSNSARYHRFNSSTTSNGDIIITGSSIKSLSIGYRSDAFITRINNRGEILWSRPYGSSDEDDWGWAITEKPNGDLIMVGSTKSFNSSLFDILLIKTDSNGN